MHASRTRAMRSPLAWLLGACIVLLAACAALPPRNPPRIDIVAVQLDRVDGPNAYFDVTVNLSNDGDDEIVVTALDGRLAIEDENVAEATLVAAPVRIPAHGQARADLSSRTGMDSLLRAIAAAMRRGATITTPGARPTLRYSIEGSATLRGGYRMRFSRTGELGDTGR
jgi:LEA14-like dessication related protein